LESQSIEQHPCYDEEAGILQGYVCPFCMKVYPSKDMAVRCKEAHDDFEVDYFFEKGKIFPAEVIVKRIKGNKLIQVATYKPEKVEELEDGKVKRTIQGQI